MALKKDLIEFDELMLSPLFDTEFIMLLLAFACIEAFCVDSFNNP
jgi:hypothetical protein